jgi:hypothetical protein
MNADSFLCTPKNDKHVHMLKFVVNHFLSSFVGFRKDYSGPLFVTGHHVNRF